MGRINSYNIISAANTNPTDKLVIETSNGTKAINISDLSATIWASLTNKDTVPTNGSTNLITSGAVFTALGNKLGFGGNLNSAQELTKSQFDDLILTNDTVYKILFAEDFFYEGSQSRYGYVIQFSSLLRLIYNPYEGLFYCTKTLNNYTEWTDCISSFGSGSIQDGSVNYNKLASDVQTLLNNKLDSFIDTSTLVTAAMLNSSAYLNQKHYYIRLAADVLFSGQSAGIGVHLISVNRTQYVLTDGYGIYSRQVSSSSWHKITRINVSYSDLSTELQDIIDTVPEDPMFIRNKGSLSIPSALDSGDFCTNGGVLKFTAVPPLSSSIGIGGVTFCEIRYINSYQYVFAPSTQQIFARKVNSVEPTFNAESWVEIVNPRITSLENTVGTLNTTLENALNGTSS